MNHAAKSFFQNWIQIFEIILELWFIFKGHRDLLQLEEKGSRVFPGCINISKSSSILYPFPWQLFEHTTTTLVGLCQNIQNQNWLLAPDSCWWRWVVCNGDGWGVACVMRCGYHQMILRIFRSVNPVGGGTSCFLPRPSSLPVSFECFIKFVMARVVCRIKCYKCYDEYLMNE